MALSFAFWSGMALVEWFNLGESLRINCSAFNNASLIMSFSFIDHGWKKLSLSIQKVGWAWIAVSIWGLTFVIGSLERFGHWFGRTDAALSIMVLGALSIGLAATFPKRGMFLMSIFSIITGIIFILTQYYVLVDKGHLATRAYLKTV